LAKLYSGTFRGLLEGEGEAMADFLARTIRSLQKKSNNFYKFHALFNRLERLAKGTATDYLILGNLSYKMERYASAIQYFEKSFSLSPDAESMNSLLGAYVAVEKFDEAEKLFTQHRKLANRTSDCYDLSLRLARKSNSAVELAAKLEDDLERYQGVCGNYLERLLGDFHFQAGRFRKAIDFYEAYAETADSDIDVLGKRIAAHLIMGDRDSASQLMHEFADLQVEESDRLVKVASFYRERGLLKDADVLSARANRIAGAAHP
jgi:tetratricopeptide (TPR) repeat protein